MATYLFAFHGGGMPETDEERATTTAAWSAWYEELGPAVIDAGNPVGAGRLVHPDGNTEPTAGDDPVTGYSLIEAATIDDAVGMALGCPIRDAGGRIEVLETIEAM